MKHIQSYFYKLGPAISAAAILSVASLALGDSGITPAPTNLLSSPSAVVAIFCGILVWMFWGLVVLGIAMFFVGGYKYATSGGDAERVSGANKTLLYAAIAIVIALVAKGVPLLIGSFLGATNGVNNVCP